jgi:hypothetical protein
VSIVRKSGLVEESKLNELLEERRSTHADHTDDSVSSLSTMLVERELLTPWQAAKLRDDKYKGFFLDEFVLLDHLADDEYLARERAGNRQVVLRFIRPPEQPWWRIFSRPATLQYEVEGDDR